MKKSNVKNKILRAARTPMCRPKVFVDRKKEARKNGQR